MRWDSLFDDLESQLERGVTAEEADLEAEEERLRLARLTLRDRLLALAGDSITLILTDGQRLALRPSIIGRDWLSGDSVDEPRWSYLVPFAAVAAISLTPVRTRMSLRVTENAPALSDRLGLPFVLRDLCRRRSFVLIDVSGWQVSGTIDRVGREHFDIAVHTGDTPRRESAISEVRIVALSSVQLVRMR